MYLEALVELSTMIVRSKSFRERRKLSMWDYKFVALTLLFGFGGVATAD
jgi:hypothetical protein